MLESERIPSTLQTLMSSTYVNVFLQLKLPRNPYGILCLRNNSFSRCAVECNVKVVYNSDSQVIGEMWLKNKWFLCTEDLWFLCLLADRKRSVLDSEILLFQYRTKNISPNISANMFVFWEIWTCQLCVDIFTWKKCFSYQNKCTWHCLHFCNKWEE